MKCALKCTAQLAKILRRSNCRKPLRSLQEYVFADEQYCQHVHQRGYLVPVATGQVNDNIGNDADGYAFGNAVEQRHGNYAQVARDRSMIAALAQRNFPDASLSQ